jgi:hypothetical protein
MFSCLGKNIYLSLAARRDAVERDTRRVPDQLVNSEGTDMLKTSWLKTLAFANIFVIALATGTQAAALLSPLVVNGERYFTVEWQAADANGRPTVYGRVRNEYGFPAHKMRLLIDSLDASGAVTAQTFAYVPFDVTPGTGAYFEARVPVRAASYRVSIFQWELGQSGGGDSPRR